MVKFEALPLADIYNSETEDALKRFDCPKNRSVENFIRNKAYNFSLQGISQTHIVLALDGNNVKTVGFFALSNKVITVPRSNVTVTFYKKIVKFGSVDAASDSVTMSAPLIAQLGKNFSNDYNKLITGKELLMIACDKVRKAQDIIGGRAVFLECEDVPKLTAFYIDNGFVSFGRRAPGEGDDGDLIQMIRYQR
ncbi:MAG: N-acetyltransferase [Ruminococcus sp.]|nr:N-acetyltransferase [Ruminococcus sp.]